MKKTVVIITILVENRRLACQKGENQQKGEENHRYVICALPGKAGYDISGMIFQFKLHMRDASPGKAGYEICISSQSCTWYWIRINLKKAISSVWSASSLIMSCPDMNATRNAKHFSSSTEFVMTFKPFLVIPLWTIHHCLKALLDE